MLEVFLYKRNFEVFHKFNLFNETQRNKIVNSFKGIDNYINKIINKKDNIYFQCFALFSYNLKRFLLLKKKEAKKETKKENYKSFL